MYTDRFILHLICNFFIVFESTYLSTRSVQNVCKEEETKEIELFEMKII